MSHGVSVKEYLELLETAGIEIEEKEVAKLEKMASDDGLVERHDFIHYAKKSSMFKTLVDAEKHHFDKAELAFKVSISIKLLFICVFVCPEHFPTQSPTFVS